MKATILVRDLVKLIAKHGDLDVQLCIEVNRNEYSFAEVKCVDETEPSNFEVGVTSFELYGEEK